MDFPPCLRRRTTNTTVPHLRPSYSQHLTPSLNQIPPNTKKEFRKRMMADESQSSGGRRASATAAAAVHPPEQTLKCPRCDSPNTKFCYYNNYSLSQPRHFCKTCRRYWTKGGALRNVPVGGGCRKNKKSNSSSVSSSLDPIVRFPEPSGSGQKFLNAPSSLGGDLHIGMLPFTRLHSPPAPGVFNSNQFLSFVDIPSSNATVSSPAGTISAPMFGLNYQNSAVGIQNEMVGSGSSSVVNGNTHSSLISSIESLSSINQDLHLKLQQQRLATFFGGKAHKESNNVSGLASQQEQASFHIERSKDEVYGGNSSPAAWLLESTCTTPTTSIKPTTDNNNNSANSNSDNTTNNWHAISGWNDVHQYTTLP